ncbi:MAG: UDP-N-acetylmuramoyl-tripeptide--D-alanyl-D-alanine ligase [Vicinamibacterales bacterium]
MAGRAVPLAAADMAAAMRGRIVSGDPATVPGGFSIDSRILAPGQAFFAIVAERDGHEFVADAAAKGAAVVVVSRAVELPAAGPVVVQVADTTRALQDLGREVRRRSGAKVVAITGSAGKTTTKEATAAFLEAAFTVVKNPGNLNNHLGLPLSLLEMRHGADVAVMELGMNHAGEIRVLVGIAEPEVRVWTNVGDAHIGHFGSADAIADAKAEILEGAGPDALFVGNADDSRVMARARAFAGRTVTFGYGEGAGVRAVDVEDMGLEGMQATLVTARGRRALRVPLLGRGNLANVLCAAAVATEMGVPLDDVVARAATLKPARRRGEVLALGGDVRVVDDSYNSSPSALMRALEMLSRERHAARRVAVLGEMLELGDQSVALHEACGRAAAGSGIAVLVTVGGEPAWKMGEAAVAAGMGRQAVVHAATSAEAAGLVASLVADGDVVLVKGSRGIRTEQVVDRIVAVRG